jgi:hypothetical protein
MAIRTSTRVKPSRSAREEEGVRIVKVEDRPSRPRA